MVSSPATSVSAYMGALDPAARDVIGAVRALVNAHLPAGFVECMQYGMISWVVPVRPGDPSTYNGQPLAVVSLAAQKNGCSLYLMGAYAVPDVDARLRQAYQAAGKKLDMGKSCLRFKRYDDLVVDAVAKAIAAATPDDVRAFAEAARGGTAKKPTKKTAKKPTKKPTKKAPAKPTKKAAKKAPAKPTKKAPAKPTKKPAKKSAKKAAKKAAKK